MPRLYPTRTPTSFRTRRSRTCRSTSSPAIRRRGCCRPGSTIPVGQTTIAGRLRRAPRHAGRRHARVVHEPDHRARQRHPRPRQGHPRPAAHARADLGPAPADRRSARRAPAGALAARPQPRRAHRRDQPQGQPAPDRGPGRRADDRGARQPERRPARRRSRGCPGLWPQPVRRSAMSRGCPMQLGPTATALIPTARRLPPDAAGLRTLFQGAALLPLNQIPPFIGAVTAAGRRSCRPSSNDLQARFRR